MKSIFSKRALPILAMIAGFLLPAMAGAAVIPGIPGPTFSLTAKTGSIAVDDGSSIYMWGFANGTGGMQYPGPTLIVNQNDAVQVDLTNSLSVPVSIVFPGQQAVGAAMVTGTGNPGLLTLEANPGETVRYTFTASQPGTYIYHSGTRPELQVEMGLVGALIVRPSMATPGGFTGCGYDDAVSCFHHEYLFLLSEISPKVHGLVLQGRMNELDNTDESQDFPVYWFINGRAGFDTILPAFAPYFPSQPYGALAQAHPKDVVLVRMIGATRDLHPFHLHGNHHRVIARDGRLLKTGATDLSEFAFTTTVAPGQTFDALFTWTGVGIGWDIYGHQDVDNPPLGNFPGPEDIDHNGDGIVNCSDPTAEELAVEDPIDHCRPMPVLLPDNKDLTFGPLYTGSPFLGSAGALPPGEGGFNPNNGLPFMWHSHSEKELTSNNIFPGGMLTFIIIQHPSVLIP